MVNILAPESKHTQVQSVAPLIRTTESTIQPVLSSVAPQFYSASSPASTIDATTVVSPEVIRPTLALHFYPLVDFMIRKSQTSDDLSIQISWLYRLQSHLQFEHRHLLLT